MEDLKSIMNHVRTYAMGCECISDYFRQVCIKEKSIQVRRIKEKEGWTTFDILQILKDLCPIKQNISEQWTKWGLQTMEETQA